MSDILERLREAARGGDVFVSPGQAADKIEELEDRIEMLEAALEKAADEYETLGDCLADLEFALERASDALHDAGCYEAWAKARAALEGGKS